jgi:hypothetical protein
MESKNAAFWDIKSSSYLIRNTLSPLQCPDAEFHVRFEVFMAVTMTFADFWDIRTQFVPHRKHYVSATEPSPLSPCKI